MTNQLPAYRIVADLFSFLKRVLSGFLRNQGLLLSGAVAYYTLLSIVPLSIIALIVLTNFIEEKQLILTLSTYLEMMIPGYAATLTEQVESFLMHRKVIGVIGFLGMLFFSSTTFSMLESAMTVIFPQRIKKHRNYLVSAIIPYLFIFALGIGIIFVSGIVGAIETLESRHLALLGWSLDLGGAQGVVLYVLGIIGEALLFTSIYLVMPSVRIKLQHAMIGGIAAAFLWEISRRVVIWYYSVFTMVNVIYGSITITVIALVSIEVAAVILLLGAQVIAELEQSHGKSSEVGPVHGK